MKTAKPDLKASREELRREDDATSLKGGVRGKYFKRYAAGTNVVRLDADVSKAFPNDKSVNDALRLLVTTAKKVVRTKSA